MLIKNAVIFTPDGFKSLDLRMENGVIAELSEHICGEGCDGEGHLLLPGLIDIHTHGYAGGDVMDGAESVLGMARGFVKHGVTAFVPTTMCASVKDTIHALNGVKCAICSQPDNGAKILGAHMEGPFINAKYKGAQPENGIFPPTRALWDEITAGYVDIIRLMTMAPEMPGALDLAKHVSALNIKLSIGHTDATVEQCYDAIAAGFTQVTHLFNGMNPLNHRAPGVPGSSLTMPELMPQVIADGVHLHTTALKLAAKCKGASGMILITDSMMATGLGDGTYTLGTQNVFVKDGQARLAGGTLAGSTLTLDGALRTMICKCNLAPETVIPMATETPARSIGETRRGAIRVGHYADLSLFTPDYRPLATWVEGKEVWRLH